MPLEKYTHKTLVCTEGLNFVHRKIIFSLDLLLGKETTQTLSFCPYHGWGYDLSGKLCHIKKKEDFLGTVDESLHTYQTLKSQVDHGSA